LIDLSREMHLSLFAIGVKRCSAGLAVWTCRSYWLPATWHRCGRRLLMPRRRLADV